MAGGRRMALALGLAAAALPARDAFSPTSWDFAEREAERTLDKMNETLLSVSGFCRRQIFLDGLLFQRRGETKSGANYYSVAGYFLYYDPSCDGGNETAGRWIISKSMPSLARESDLDEDGECSADIYAQSGDSSRPPMGTEAWEMPCSDSDDNLTRVDLTLRMVPQGEKYSLLRGVGWDHPANKWFDVRKYWYVGNTVAIPRLNLPSLNMQDAASGFRTMFPEVVDTVTVFPCLLALAATWDEGAVRQLGVALGEEFSMKGANGILGPSVAVHRVARNGRNFEYLSGEDPYLGERLTPAYVEGVQSQGVFAVMKHWVFNHQESHRNDESSVVDDKTAHELYYPPFQAGVDAGVSAVMCSYNRIDGEYSCANKKHLSVLHDEMGFRGFVQSDWWAAHKGVSLSKGLDQEMPGAADPPYFDAEGLKKEDQEAVDTAVKRILAVMYRMKLTETPACSPPNCEPSFKRDVSTPAHVGLARNLAAKSVVLLKNNDSTLPLSRKVKKIAIIGSAAVAKSYDPAGQGQNNGEWFTGDYYSGGGSGHITSKRVVSAFSGLQKRAKQLGIEVVHSDTNDVGHAIKVASEADVAIVVAATTSGESVDRKDLQLDDNADVLIKAISSIRSTKTVVLVQAPGAVTMPWKDDVHSIMVMFLGGQETGNAWADVVFGDLAPEGRLPIMIPATEADAVVPEDADNVIITYSERMETSYRSSKFKAAYPFGHGLTYTTFDYSQAAASKCSSAEHESCRAHGGKSKCALCIQVFVKNTGEVAAKAVPQLYLQLPPQAGLPCAILRGFQKTAPILPGSSSLVSFALRERDVSFYDVGRGAFVRANGTFWAYVGESSADRRATVQFCLGDCTGGVSIVGWALFAAALLAPLLAVMVVRVGLVKKRVSPQGTEGFRPLVHDA